LSGKKILAMQGRVHVYEGYEPQLIAFPVRVIKLLGIDIYIATNAAGSTSREFKPADLMIIEDHINNMGISPLVGKNIDNLGPRFNDMTFAYDRSYMELTQKCAKKLNINIKKGIYCANLGPSYETPAEVRMMNSWGAHAMGMSTVPEVITASHCGMRILGISCITNYGAGILDQPLNHEEVIEIGQKVSKSFKALIKEIVKEIK
ncbi:MAG: purine-nucleoside phosphorylase, partial [Spirochaetes bacterium]|nr:purine-nucleoside phosphorylase [Spirochaetota bacterium]